MLGPLLVLLDLSKTFEVHCGSFGDSLGAILSQESHTIAYESRHLQPQERSLGIYEKQLLAVIYTLDAWKHYLLGMPFIISIDHHNIKYFMT